MQRIFRVLQDCYHLTADNVWLIPSGMLNCNYKVQTAEGTYVLKQYRAELYTLEDIQRACAVQDYVLQQATVPTARLIPNIDGRFVTRHDNDTYVLSEFVEGRQYRRGEIPDQAAYEMGRALGQLHLIMSRVPDIKPYRWKTAEEVLPRLESLLRAAEARSRTSTVDANAAQVLRYKIEILSTWNGRPSTWEGQPSQWVHEISRKRTCYFPMVITLLRFSISTMFDVVHAALRSFVRSALASRHSKGFCHKGTRSYEATLLKSVHPRTRSNSLSKVTGTTLLRRIGPLESAICLQKSIRTAGIRSYNHRIAGGNTTRMR